MNINNIKTILDEVCQIDTEPKSCNAKHKLLAIDLLLKIEKELGERTVGINNEKILIYKCNKCSYSTSASTRELEGIKCPKCEGILRDRWTANLIEGTGRTTHKGLSLSVNLKDTDAFKNLLSVTEYLLASVSEEIQSVAVERIKSLKL